MKTFFTGIFLFTIISFSSAQQCYTPNMNTGKAEYENENYEKAISYFETAKSCPDRPGVSDANMWIEKCETKPKEDLFYIDFNKGKTYYNKAEYEQAISSFKKSKNSTASHLYYKANEWIEKCENAKKNNVTNCYNEHINLANTARQNKDYSIAIDHYTQAKECKYDQYKISYESIKQCDKWIEECNTKRNDLVLKKIETDMIYVSGGTFTMGCTKEQGPASKYFPAKPTHSVTLSSFYICKYEVTRTQWCAVMGCYESPPERGNYPKEIGLWDDIQTFITKLNQQTGKSYRLPTEAEWEFAARGGNSSRGYMYSGSNNISSVAWYDDNSGEKAHPVGQKQANELGIYDMSGNVEELCSDWVYLYSRSSQTNPKGPSSPSFENRRVCRGGACVYNSKLCRSSYRSSRDPVYPNGSGIGFRLVLDSQ